MTLVLGERAPLLHARSNHDLQPWIPDPHDATRTHIAIQMHGNRGRPLFGVSKGRPIGDANDKNKQQQRPPPSTPAPKDTTAPHRKRTSAQSRPARTRHSMSGRSRLIGGPLFLFLWGLSAAGQQALVCPSGQQQHHHHHP